MTEPTEETKERVVEIDGVQIDVRGDLTDEQVREFYERTQARVRRDRAETPEEPEEEESDEDDDE